MAKEHQNQFELWYAISLAFQLGFLTILPIGGFMLLGLWGDRAFHTFPWLLITGTLIGVGTTIYETYDFFLPLMKKHDQD